MLFAGGIGADGAQSPDGGEYLNSFFVVNTPAFFRFKEVRIFYFTGILGFSSLVLHMNVYSCVLFI